MLTEQEAERKLELWAMHYTRAAVLMDEIKNLTELYESASTRPEGAPIARLGVIHGTRTGDPTGMSAAWEDKVEDLADMYEKDRQKKEKELIDLRHTKNAVEEILTIALSPSEIELVREAYGGKYTFPALAAKYHMVERTAQRVAKRARTAVQERWA